MWTRTLRTTTTRRMRRRALSPLTTPQDHQQVLLLILQLRKHTSLSGFVNKTKQLSLWWGQYLSNFYHKWSTLWYFTFQEYSQWNPWWSQARAQAPLFSSDSHLLLSPGKVERYHIIIDTDLGGWNWKHFNSLQGIFEKIIFQGTPLQSACPITDLSSFPTCAGSYHWGLAFSGNDNGPFHNSRPGLTF